MYIAYSLKDICEEVSKKIPREVSFTKKEPIPELGFMTAYGGARPIRYQNVNVTEERNSKLIGVLFCHPKSPLAENEILDHLNIFHHRSGDAVDFFCVGYGAYWPPDHYADQDPVTNIGGINWLFSSKAFSDTIEEFEREFDWKYSGETELILLAAQKNKGGAVKFDVSTAIVCNLERMVNDKAIKSVRSFFIDIFNFAKRNTENDPTWGFSDQKGIDVGKSALKAAILSVIPKEVRKMYEKGEHFAVRNLNKD